MKRLILMRHAKSSWSHPGLEDHERPLNKRGRRDAPRMGRLIHDTGCVPRLILSSTAVRARETAQAVLDEADPAPPLTLTAELYHATPEEIRTVIGRAPSNVDCLLVVGHNPGLEDFLEQLIGRYERLPTAAVAIVELRSATWMETRSPANLLEFWTPRTLPPSSASE